MLDKIFCISSEHQPYRRAAQLTALQLHGYPNPLEIFDIIWANHRNDYTDVELVEMMVSHGLENYRYALDEPFDSAVRNYSLSCMEAHVRALLKVVKLDVNAIILQDDFLLTIDYRDIEAKLSRFLRVIEDGVVQLHYNQDSTIEFNRILRPVKDVPDFAHGSLGSSQAAMFFTPRGASLLLEALSKLQRPSTIEEHIISDFADDSWIYSVLHPHMMVEQSILQGDSIAVWHTKQAHLANRSSNLQIAEENMGFIEKYKLGGHYDKDKQIFFEDMQ